MEEVFQLGTRVKDQDEDHGSRRAVPAGCQSEEGVHVERGARHRHGRPSGGRTGRADRMGEGGQHLSLLRGEQAMTNEGVKKKRKDLVSCHCAAAAHRRTGQ